MHDMLMKNISWDILDVVVIEINKTNRSKGRNVLLITGNAMSL